MAASTHVPWYAKKSKGWDYLRSTPLSSLLLLYAAAFLLFSTIGFFTDLMSGGHLPYAAVLFGAFLSGVDAAMWIYVLSRRPLIWMILPLAFSLSIGVLESAVTGWLMQREFPRLCRGGSRSLTYSGVHPETPRREPPSTHQGETGWTSMRA